MSEPNVIPMFKEPAAGGANEAFVPIGGAPEAVVEPPDPLHKRDFLAHEFLLWLWCRSERDFGQFMLAEGPVDLWFDDALTFLALDEKRIVSAFRGGAPSTTPEARLSILAGKIISEAKLGMKQGEHEWGYLLRVRGGELQLHGLKIPAQLKTGPEEMVYERMHLIGWVNRVIQELFQRFFQARISSEWRTRHVPELTEWLMGEPA